MDVMYSHLRLCAGFKMRTGLLAGEHVMQVGCSVSDPFGPVNWHLPVCQINHCDAKFVPNNRKSGVSVNR